jgi:5-oxoprolinase (ATP-hydrolysing) subunit A
VTGYKIEKTIDMHIDLNCDLGEGFPHDAELMRLITSANVCCAAHAGDADTTLATLRLAAEHGVQVGAHPGFADREHFGRRELGLAAEQIRDQCTSQITLAKRLAELAGVRIRYVKPHGALYNMACRDDVVAHPVLAAIEPFGLAVMALPGSRLQALCIGRCPFIAEGFADRSYLPDGSLVPRSRPDAFVKDPLAAVRQAEWLIRERGVQTLCVHGDNPLAVEFVRALRINLQERGHSIAPFALP